MYDYSFLLLMLILIIYPIPITFFMLKKVNSTGKFDFKTIGKNLLFLFTVDLIGVILIFTVASLYDNIVPSTNSNLCHNTGGWNSECLVDDYLALMHLIPMLLIIGIHHFISIKFINKILENSKKIIPYIFMYIRMVIIYFVEFYLLIMLYGLFIYSTYRSVITEIIRFITITSPTLFYIVSCIIHKKNKA